MVTDEVYVLVMHLKAGHPRRMCDEASGGMRRYQV